MSSAVTFSVTEDGLPKSSLLPFSKELITDKEGGTGSPASVKAALTAFEAFTDGVAAW